MKKIFAIIAIIAAASVVCSAQNTTRIGEKHAVNFSAYYGYSTGTLSNFGGGSLDINARNSNFRTRLGFEIEQVQLAFCPAGYVDFQYLAKLAEGFYLYPFAGAELEYHDASNWDKKFDYAPQAGLGLEYQFNSNFGLFLQGRYRYGIAEKNNFISGQAGIVFAFGPGSRGNGKVEKSAIDAEAARIAAQKAAADKAAADEAARIAAKKAAAEKAAAEAEAARLAAQKAAADEAAAEAAKRVSAHNILFPLGSSFVDEAGREQIAEAVEILKKYSDATVEIKGYADKETGSADVNMTLSRKRAEAVKTFFTSAGVPEQNIKVSYFGDTVNPFNTPEANRVVIVTTK